MPSSQYKCCFLFLFLLSCIQLAFLSVLIPSLPNDVEPPTQTQTTISPNRTLSDGCYHIFLDVGSHIGIHARFLYEPNQYPKSTSVALFAREFGMDRDNRDICVFAFEPNPKYLPRHLELEKVYSAMGWRYHAISAGVSNMDGYDTFYHTHAKERGETGFSASGKTNLYGDDSEAAVVPIVRLATWIQREIYNRRIPEPYKRHPKGPRVVMKFDIEGSEYKVFPDLFMTGVLCNTVHFMFGEFHQTAHHHNLFPMNLTSDGQNVLELKRAWLLAESFVRMVEITEHCVTRIKMVDDESYKEDPVEYPKPL